MKRQPDAIAAHDPGGAEILAAIAAKMPQPPLLSLAGPALRVFERRLGTVHSLPLDELLAALKPGQLLVTGTSVESPHELRALHGAHARGISSAAFLDSWINFEHRFSGRGGVEPVLPTEIWVGDFHGYAAAVKAGYLDRLRLVTSPLVAELKTRLAELRARRPADTRRALLMLEPVGPLAKVLRPDCAEGLGFDENKFLEQLLTVLLNGPTPFDSVVVRPHPRDEPGKYDAILERFSALPIGLSTEPDFAADIASASCIIGMETIGLYYGVLAGIRAISFIPSETFTCRLPHPEIERAQNAAELASLLASSCVRSASSKRLPARAFIEEGKLRAAVIGLGKMGLGFDLQSAEAEIFSHTKAFIAHPRFELVGGADPDPARRSEFERFSGVASFPDIQSLCETVKPDAVAIAVPTPLHAETVHAVLRYSPSLIVLEKPIASSFEESAALCAAAEDRGIALHVNYMRSLSPALMRIGEQIRSGRWGALRRGSISYWRGLLTNASHYINLLLGYLGDPTDFRYLQSFGAPAGLSSDRDIALELRFGGGSVMVAPFQNTVYGVGEVDLWFEQGRVRLLDFAERIEVFEPEQTPRIRGVRRLYAALAVEQPDMSRYQYDVLEHLVRSAHSPRQRREELRRALLTVKVCDDAMREAEREQAGVKKSKLKCVL